MKRTNEKTSELSSGISVILNDNTESPHCPHGPTVLFQRHGSNRAFYACSAFRDRKECQFFVWRDDFDKAKWQIRPEIEGRNFKTYNELVANDSDDYIFCHTCNELMESTAVSIKSHKGHDLRKSLKKTDLSMPSRILQAKRSSKREAQFFFSSETISVFLKIIKSHGFRSVVCLGTPTVHESIKKKIKKCDSILLDFDERLCQFFPQDQFCHYNMFNHFFFKSKEIYSKFLENSTGELLVVTDPPFGGRYELIANTFNAIKKDFCDIKNTNNINIHLIWIFPYFFENKISSVVRGIKMSDYQVLYDDNSGYKDGRLGGRKHGSPVRLFTTIPLSTMNLAGIEGYKFCSDCQVWVSSANSHCWKCGTCTAKNGGEYHHCDLCGRCVKQTWTHCYKCRTCTLSDHICHPITGKGAKRKKQRLK